MSIVYVQENESIEAALKRFTKKVNESRILIEVKERQEYIKPSERRRREAAAGKSRSLKKKNKMDKYLEFLDNHKFPPRHKKPKQESKPERILYVGSISYETTEDQLKEHFETIAPVRSVKIIIDHESGKSKGFGFVELQSQKDTTKVVEELNGKDFQSRRLVVSFNRTKAKPSSSPSTYNNARTPPVSSAPVDATPLQNKYNKANAS